MATIEEIKQQAEAVKNATQVGENTAMRVGGALSGLSDIAKEQEDNIRKKADKAYTDSELNKKADKEETNRLLSEKANTADVNSKFTEEKNRVDSELNKKADKEETNRLLSEKANTADVNSKFTEEKNRVDAELAKKFDKASIVQESGEAEDKVMSQKATTDAIQTEIDRAKAAEEAIIFDVSVNNNGAVFESLQAILSSSNLNTLIPASVRHGGMSIRFIHGSLSSSNNKYVQFRLMANTFSIDEADWQGVDDEPTAGSDNLVKSGGVANKLSELEKNVNDKHEEIDSDNLSEVTIDAERKILESRDKNGNKTYNTNVHFNADVSTNARKESVISHSLYHSVLVDGEDKIVYGIKNDGSVFVSSLDSPTLDNMKDDIEKAKFKDGCFSIVGNLTDGKKLSLVKSQHKSNKVISFSGKIGTFDKLLIGNGQTEGYGCVYYVIDSNNITEYYKVSSNPSTPATKNEEWKHGLTIANTISVQIATDNLGLQTVRISSNGVSASHKFLKGDNGYQGYVFAASNGSNLSNCKLSLAIGGLRSKIQIYGDSYISFGNNCRWTYYLHQEGHGNNAMFDGFAGQGSSSAIERLVENLKHSVPQYVVWLLGMNDNDISKTQVNASWKNCFERVCRICDEKGITPIFATIPSAVGGYTSDSGITNFRYNKAKNEIVKASGRRYIDFASAVGANDDTGTWYNNGNANDMLENVTDGQGGMVRVHPTKYGAEALYNQFVTDFPEILI